MEDNEDHAYNEEDESEYVIDSIKYVLRIYNVLLTVSYVQYVVTDARLTNQGHNNYNM
jgi:hypothetical protein